nr:trehalose-phosphatase [Bailinhaonella thermotolerans]
MDGLEKIVGDPSGALIGLDFDGTLSPIVPDPDSARAHPAAPGALRLLAPRVCAVVILTGRPAATAVEYGPFQDVPGLIVLGHYGQERWEDGEVVAPPPPPGVQKVREGLPDALARAGAPDGVWIEDKGRSLAVHTRRAADPQAALERVSPAVHDLAERAGLIVEPGRFVLEARPAGMDKGAALRAFARERSARSVLFAGDDLGDLAAFDAIDSLRGDGIPGVKVCSGSAEVTRLAERSDLIVDGPAGVVDFLRALAGRLPPASGSQV